MFAVYIIITVLLGLVAGYKFGKADYHTQNEIAVLLFLCVVFWPIALAGVVVLGPFALAIYLGAKTREKEKEKK